MRITRSALVVLVLATVLSAPARGAAQAERAVIGFTAALSGDFAAFGLNMRKGLELALDEINKKGGVNRVKLEATFADDRGEPKEGVLIAQKFCSDRSVKVVMGYSFSSVALAAVPIFDQCGLPVLASAVTSPLLSGSSKFFRRNVLTDAIQGAQMGRYTAQALGKKSIALIHQQDDYGIGVTDAYEKSVKEAGGTVLTREKYLLGTKDFKTQLTNIKAKNPDALFIGGFYTEAAKICQQARELGLNVPLVGTDGSLNPELMKLGGSCVEGMIVYAMFDPTVEKAEIKRFLGAYKAKHNEEPNAWAALAYDATYVVAEAARLAGNNDRAALNEAFARIKDLPGVTGTTSFDAKGDRLGPLLFLEVKGGKFVLASKQMTR